MNVKEQGTHLQVGFLNKYRNLVEGEHMEVEIHERVKLQKADWALNVS